MESKMKRATLAIAVALIGVFGISQGSASAKPTPTTVKRHPCTDPNYKSSSYSGGVAYSNYYVTNDVWNPVSITQRLSACGHNSFYVTAHVKNEGGAVQSYPNSQINFDSPTVASFATLTSNFGFKDPPTGSGLDYEFAYDIWLGGATAWADPGTHTEMMLWEYNHVQRPAGSVVGTATLDGARWTVWEVGNLTGKNGDIVTFVRKARAERGRMNLLVFFDYAAGKGWLQRGRSAHLWQVDWGAELCAAPKGSVFDFTAFNVKST